MAEQFFKTVGTDRSIEVFLQDARSIVGGGLTGLVYNASGLQAYYRIGATGTWTQITLATQTVGGAHSDGGFIETDATNAAGAYRLDLPDAVVAAAGDVALSIYGATNLVEYKARITVDLFASLVADIWANGTRTLTSASGPTAAEIADAVLDEALSGHATAGTVGKKLNDLSSASGAGAVTWTYTVTDSVTGGPLDGVEVWVSTDSAGENVIASGTTDQSGVVTFYLDAGTVYIWRKKAGYNFTNPDQETVA